MDAIKQSEITTIYSFL